MTTEIKCEVCNTEPSIGVASVPGVPMSCAYCQKCLAANAHPWYVLITNTAILGGYDNAGGWWKKMVKDTIKRLGKTREEFDADVQAAMKSMDTDGV